MRTASSIIVHSFLIAFFIVGLIYCLQIKSLEEACTIRAYNVIEKCLMGGRNSKQCQLDSLREFRTCYFYEQTERKPQ